MAAIHNALAGSGGGRPQVTFTYSSNTANASLNVASLSGYAAGNTDVTITVNAGVYVYSTSVGNAGLTLTGGTTGDTVTLVNNGFIMGMGGAGTNINTQANPGGPAISLGFNTTINNTNGSAYIGGGGGGGGRAGGGGSGGGAGGGPGGNPQAGSGGGPGSSGTNGAIDTYFGPYGVYYQGGGGGGGRIFPGSGGAGGSGGVSNWFGRGGGAGGGGASINGAAGGAGGSSNNPGGTGDFSGASNGGGGGWGASGGNTGSGGTAGGGGRAVQLNGRTVTWVSGDTSRVWGAVS